MKVFLLTLFSIFCGMCSSLIGHKVISAMFDRNTDRRMIELSSYAWGYSFSYLSLTFWLRTLYPKFHLKDNMFLSFFYNAFCYGFGVMVGGVLRTLKHNTIDGK